MALKPLKDIPEWWELCARYRYDIYAFAVEALGVTPTWQQELLFESIQFDGSRTSVASGHGCFGKGTKIRLANGKWKRVEKITINDAVMGTDGFSPREVIQVVKGYQELYQFEYANGSKHVYNKSHILCLVSLETKNGWKVGDTMEVLVSKYLEWPEETKRQFAAYELKHRKFQPVKINNVTALGEGDYYGFVLDGDSTFLTADNMVHHNTGKTASAGIVALWHLLFFEESLMMFTAPQIGQLKKQVWKEISINLSRLKAGPLGWLADYVGYQSELVYIKGYKEKWYVFAKTAAKHQPTTIAGNHGDNYAVWVDEASGVDDAILDVAFGALTHEDNRAIMTSQPTRNAGMFYETHHKLSHRAGGVWIALTFNGEESPLVSKQSLEEQRQKYGSRDDPQYQIRVLGQFPDRADEFLITKRQADDMYVGASIFEDHVFGYVITVDVGGGVGRDDSVIAVSKVWGEAQWGDRARRVEVVDIPLCKNKDDITELLGKINECILKYPNATLVVDDNGAGKGLGQLLKKHGIWYMPVYWGGACFNNDNRKEYVNKRALAYVCLKRAIESGRFKVKTRKYKVKIQDQIIKIPYTFDEHSRYKILSKDEMKRQGIKSPDLGDVFAFIFLENVFYTEAFESVVVADDSPEAQERAEKKARFDRLRKAAQALDK
ncbi:MULTISPECIES: Hint domain-containing homing endonuclease [unclassified Acinetobacter]|uniref:Hint domain-containing homing endonuclease n=1 Tax=unclassified Acinetobacter TaxID=196816 RepID=UPI002448C555|nr:MULTISPECIES: Hint domain-containing homing endonuclease [unclassified Acinetobacter]MDH0032578.1 terminase [Acinetobacter sp. GD04021]MDH0885269.1 terminase [Acinetobacter sp. GD03873]MDH1084403.1 terminase [Acinetobacter sp. GD03983]MDH2188291.1 terminase [Acinetobacter sp. GD03645]MDH2203802.1 terminase [Acinetobacter sp. GD03647]